MTSMSSFVKLNAMKITIAIVFSLAAIVLAGITDVVYVPLSANKAIDLTIIGIVFASMIGGYRVAIPVSVLWSLVTYYQIGAHFITWPFWAILLTRLIFTISVVWAYDLFRKLYEYSPYNVYRAIVASILIKNLVAIPFDLVYRKMDCIALRGEQFIIEAAICSIAMSLLIKHLRQIHILNGVRKKGKGDNGDASQDHVFGRGASESSRH